MPLDFRDIDKLPTDFEEIVELLKERVQINLPERWSDFLTSNFGVEILEAVAYESALMNYYTNASLNECFLPTAKTKNAVYNLAKTIGYSPKPPSQSVVTLKFYIPTIYNKNINIPMYTKLISSNGIPFYTIENKTLYAGETFVEVSAKSGNIQIESIISTGIKKYKYKLKNYPVNDIIEVRVNDVVYEYKEFLDEEQQKFFYTIEYDNNFLASVVFGDGKYGINPSKNSLIEIIYVSNADENHNLMPYMINQIIDTIYDSSNTPINISVINEKNAVGASNSENLDQVKRNAPSIYRTQQRCVTRQDFRDYVLTYPGIEKVSILDNSNLDEIGIFGVKVCVIPVGGGYPNLALKQNLLEKLEQKKIVSTQVDVIDPVFIPFDVNISINIQPRMSSSVITNNIRKIVYDYLHWKNRDFGQEVSYQEIYKLVSNVNGVLSINNLTVSENRKIYIKETPVVGTNIIKVYDSIGTLNLGAKINIMSSEDELILSTKIIDKDNDIITIEDIISEDMNIVNGSLIYPVLKVDGNHLYGSKEIRVKDNVIEESETRSYSLLNLSYLTVYFSDEPTKLYNILFRSGDNIYLDKPIDRDIKDDINIIILYKRNIPTLASVATQGISTIKLQNYPRFSKGASLIQKSMVSFDDKTITMYRNSSGLDYINTVFDTAYLTKVKQIYINANLILTENIDYNLLNNGKIIKWTEIGKNKIPSNTKYYLDIVAKVINTSDSDVIYYVKNIDGKYVEISPVIIKNLYENEVFEYETTTYNLLDYEIADLGSVDIVVN